MSWVISTQLMPACAASQASRETIDVARREDREKGPDLNQQHERLHR